MARPALLQALAAVLATSACAQVEIGFADRQRAITAGTTTDSDAPVVALIVADHALCTGTLIAPRVVLTAAHCLEGPIDAVAFGADAERPLEIVDVRLQAQHPGFDGFGYLDDVGLLLLAWTPSSAQPLDASPAPAAWFAPTSLRLVGFGHVGPEDDGAHVKRTGAAHIDQVTAPALFTSPGPSQSCLGDSGGPGFTTVGGQERLVAIVSQGDSSCTGAAVMTRTDVHYHSFVAPFLAAADSFELPVGARCFADEQCAERACLSAPDEPLVRYCSADCARDSECPQEMTCAEGSCRFAGPTPGTVGAPCQAASDCLSGRCSTDGYCTRDCVAGLDGQCPHGMACERVADEDDEALCTMPASAGCEVGGRARPGSPWLLLAAVLLGLLLRARRRDGVTSGRDASSGATCKRG